VKSLASISWIAGSTSFRANSAAVFAICCCSSERSSGVNTSRAKESSIRKLPPLAGRAEVVAVADFIVAMVDPPEASNGAIIARQALR